MATGVKRTSKFNWPARPRVRRHASLGRRQLWICTNAAGEALCRVERFAGGSGRYLAIVGETPISDHARRNGAMRACERALKG